MRRRAYSQREAYGDGVLSVGIDVGGTKVAGALVSDDGAIIRQLVVPTPADDTQALEDAIVELSLALSADEQVSGIGIAAAGFIDAAQSLVYYAPNIHWRNEPLRTKVEARTNLPVVVDNDANAAGWAEYRYGAGKSFTHMTLLTIGTGVGGAIITDGQLFRGGFGAGAELGHMAMVPDGILCGCGQRGCFEQYGSGRALLRYANEQADDPATGAALAASRDATGMVSADALKQLLIAEDPGALAALSTLGSWIGRACASLAAVLDPQVFVFGGGVAVAGEHLLEPIRQAFSEYLPAQGFHPEAEFRVAQLLNDAGAIGAADLVRLHVDGTRFAAR